MRRLNSKLKVDFKSEKGNDPIPKTYAAYTPLDEFICIAVAESYDNDMEENSAQLAVETVLTAFERKPSLRRIKEYLKEADRQILLHSTRNKLEVSITVIVSDYTRMRYGILGNTKLSIFYENTLQFVSKTQTKYEQILEKDARVATKEPEQFHNLTQYLGMSGRIRPILSTTLLLQENATIVLSTSNLSNLVSDIELLDAYENTKTNEELLDSTEELLLGKQEFQSIGSYTIAAIFIEKVFKEDNTKKKKIKKWLIRISILIGILLLIAAIVIFILRMLDRRKFSELEQINKRAVTYLDHENFSKSLTQYEEALEITDKLAKNGQYKKRKKEWKTLVSNRIDLLTALQEAEEELDSESYAEAKKLYLQVKKEAQTEEVPQLLEYIQEKIEQIDTRLEIEQWITLGDTCQATKDYEGALQQYEQALEAVKQIKDIELAGELQVKIYEIKQKKKEEAADQKEEEEQEKQEGVNQKIKEIQGQILSANDLLSKGYLANAKDLATQILYNYRLLGSSGEEAQALYQEIVALQQAILEEEADREAQKEEEQLKKIQKYILQAKEYGRQETYKKAIETYEKALASYKKLDIWDERVEEIYDSIDALKQERAQKRKQAKEEESSVPEPAQEAQTATPGGVISFDKES